MGQQQPGLASLPDHQAEMDCRQDLDERVDEALTESVEIRDVDKFPNLDDSPIDTNPGQWESSQKSPR